MNDLTVNALALTIAFNTNSLKLYVASKSPSSFGYQGNTANAGIETSVPSLSSSLRLSTIECCKIKPPDVPKRTTGREVALSPIVAQVATDENSKTLNPTELYS